MDWPKRDIRFKHRDALKAYLEQQGVSTVIHYPIPPHRQACYQDFKERNLPIVVMLAGEVLSLPMSSSLEAEEIEHVTKNVLGFQQPLVRRL